MEKKLSVGIVGASGYSGELLMALLARHPAVELVVVASRSHVGKSIEEVCPRLRGLFSDLVFSQSEPVELASNDSVDLWFLALPHGVASEFAAPLVARGRRVIDLSADFRLSSPEVYEMFYGTPHPNVDLLKEAKYVIPELAEGSAWKQSPLLACPGCYPTSVIVPLFPLLEKGIVSTKHIVINSFSGVSGAGKKATSTFSYCERDENCTAYGAPKHRHLSEVEMELSRAAKQDITVQFTPHLAPMNRGIATTITVPARENLDDLYSTWWDAYENAQFVRVLASGIFPETAHVVGTNRVDIAAVYDERTKNFVITSAIDNLMKGASGQAVQIMNLVFGYNEEDGLI